MNNHIIISYSRGDGRTFALKLYTDLKKFGLNSWIDSEDIPAGANWVAEIAKAIKKSLCVIVILTPKAVASDEVTAEWRRALDLKKPVYPLMVKSCEVPPILSIKQYIDFRKLSEYHSQLEILVKQLGVQTPVKSDHPDSEFKLEFHNRERELEQLLKSLNKDGDDHFYTIIGGPKMGKSWFMTELEERLREVSDDNWEIRKVDLRDIGTTIDTPEKLIGLFFNIPHAVVITKGWLEDRANEMIRMKKCFLWLLDGADGMQPSIEKGFRTYVSQLHQYISSVAVKGVRFCFVGASSRPINGWVSVYPRPKFTTITLGHFSLNTIKEALRDVISQEPIEYDFGHSWYDQVAPMLQSQTEGFPALLEIYIKFLLQRLFTPEILIDQNTFGELAVPYIQSHLLSSESLIPFDRENRDVKRDVLENVLHHLSPYRLFTASHIEPIVKSKVEKGLRKRLGAKWFDKDVLRDVIAETYLTRPMQQQYWSEIYTSIRCLLFRYYYRDTPDQAEAHRQASEFYKDWWITILSGTDQLAFAIEYLWHYAENIRLGGTPPDDAPPPLSIRKETVETLRSILPGGSCNRYGVASKPELIETIINKLEQDEEFQNTLNKIQAGLYDTIIQEIYQI